MLVAMLASRTPPVRRDLRVRALSFSCACLSAVTVKEPTRALVWSKADLQALFFRAPTLAVGWSNIVSTDLLTRLKEQRKQHDFTNYTLFLFGILAGGQVSKPERKAWSAPRADSLQAQLTRVFVAQGTVHAKASDQSGNARARACRARLDARRSVPLWYCSQSTSRAFPHRRMGARLAGSRTIRAHQQIREGWRAWRLVGDNSDICSAETCTNSASFPADCVVRKAQKLISAAGRRAKSSTRRLLALNS